MSATGSAVGRPLVVGLGGTEREGSVTEACVREALHAAERGGARVELFGAGALDLPMFKPTVSRREERVVSLVEAIRECDGLVLGSPGYHGDLSGLVKNALDYLEDLHDDPRPTSTVARSAASRALTAGRRPPPRSPPCATSSTPSAAGRDRWGSRLARAPRSTATGASPTSGSVDGCTSSAGRS
jgi:NADPH-dependent FMN reductase